MGSHPATTGVYIVYMVKSTFDAIDLNKQVAAVSWYDNVALQQLY